MEGCKTTNREVLGSGLCFGPEVVKLFSCSTQLSLKFNKLLINTEITQIY